MFRPGAPGSYVLGTLSRKRGQVCAPSREHDPLAPRIPHLLENVGGGCPLIKALLPRSLTRGRSSYQGDRISPWPSPSHGVLPLGEWKESGLSVQPLLGSSGVQEIWPMPENLDQPSPACPGISLGSFTFLPLPYLSPLPGTGLTSKSQRPKTLLTCQS